MKKHIDNFVASAIDWVFRRRSPGLSLVRVGSLILLAILTSWALSLKVTSKFGTLNLALQAGDGPSALIIMLALSMAIVLIGIGIVMTILDFRKDQRKKIIAIELRGLRDTSGQPLANKISCRLKGRRDQRLVDVRFGADGYVIEPEEAISRISQIPHIISQSESGIDRGDITLVAAALAPVPYSFLFGVLLDDEGFIEVMDWDRNALNWRPIEGEDDNRRFDVSGLNLIQSQSDCVLAVSASYIVSDEALTNAFPQQTIVRMVLDDHGTDAHWSSEKQSALTAEFFTLVRTLGDRGVRRIHLILAAPNSLAINFGRAYDKRNLPELVVYQFEKAPSPGYPWGVLMPVAGRKIAEILKN